MTEKKINFNKILQHPRMKYLHTAHWFEYICKRINKDQNFLCVVVGGTGSGKSTAALAAAEILDEGFSIDRVAFSAQEFLQLVKSDLKPGSCIVFDEAGLGMGKRDWYSETNKKMIKLLQLFRYKNLIVFFTVPSLDYIDSGSQKLMHAEWIMQYIDPHRNKSWAKAFCVNVEPRTGEKHSRYLIVTDNLGVKNKIKHIFFRLPSLALRNRYDAKKKQFAENLYDDMLQEFGVFENPEDVIKFEGIEREAKEHIERNKNIKGKELGIILGVSAQKAGRLKLKVLDKIYELENMKKIATEKDRSETKKS